MSVFGEVIEMQKNRIRQSAADNLFDIINHGILLLVLLAILYPLVYILSCSFSDSNAVVAGRVWLLPVEPTLIGYTAVFQNKQIITGYLNSIFYALVGTGLNLVLTFMAAYPLSRKNVIMGRGKIMFFFTFTMLFKGGMIPTYLLVNRLGMVNTRWSIIIPAALSVWNVVITRTFLATSIPEELYDAAEIDGSGDISTFFRIVLPLSGTIITVNALFYAVGHWNAYFNAMIYLRNVNLFPLQIVLRNILLQNQIDLGMVADIEELQRREALMTLLKYSLIVISTAPIMIVYPFVQKFFVKGIMIGSIKG